MERDRKGGYDVSSRIVRIRLTDGTLVNGQVNLLREPGYERLSDLVGDTATPFLVVYDAVVYDEAADHPVRRNSLFINKTQILWVEPDEDQK